ncbi:hypothetical protein GGD38_004921 [Chitinophagaceae bacterium OAS944]|nr:hypothetical protein [Chitinophagaceae bacterium OAS944]
MNFTNVTVEPLMAGITHTYLILKITLCVRRRSADFIGNLAFDHKLYCLTTN